MIFGGYWQLVLVPKHSQHASFQFVVSFLKPVSLELNFLRDVGFVLCASDVNRFLGGNEDVVGSLNTVDGMVEAVQVRLKQHFNSEGLVHQTLDPSTHSARGLLENFLITV